MTARLGVLLGFWFVVESPFSILSAGTPVQFTQSARTVDCYDFVEVTITVANPPKINPFTETDVTGVLFREPGKAACKLPPLKVDGFCDSEDGSVFRIRFMPTRPGQYGYGVTYMAAGVEKT